MTRIWLTLVLLPFLYGTTWAKDDQTDEPAQAEAAPSQPAQEQPAPGNEPQRVRRLGDSLATDPSAEWVPGLPTTVDDAALERKLTVAERALANGDLLAPPNANALYFFQQVLDVAPDNVRAREGLNQIADSLVTQARQAQAAGNDVRARSLLAQIRSFAPDYPGIDQLEADIGRRAEIEALQTSAEAALAAGRLDQPAGDNALETFQALLAIDAGSTVAAEGVAAVQRRLLAQAQAAVDADDLPGAQELLDRAETAGASGDGPASIRGAMADVRRARQIARLTAIEAQVAAGDVDAAEAALGELLGEGFPADERTAAIDVEIARVRRVRAFPPGTTINDDFSGGGQAPTMIIVPGGSFEMGSPRSDRDRGNNEGPQQTVTFAIPFALGQTEVTVAQFRIFVETTGHVTDAEQAGESTIYNVLSGNLKKESGISWRNSWQGQNAEDDDPVVHVSWNDAMAYAAWVAQETGEAYRLPTESEFEYALRAGTTTPFWWGRGAPRDTVENLTGEEDRMAGRWEWPAPFERYGDDHWGPAPVASFTANPFGLLDIGGNVMEWVADCYVASLDGVPLDGSARPDAGECNRVLRGGSWATPPAKTRSAQRTTARPTQSTSLVGFRLARSL
ncbi:MAG: SUMF1/EgtB/PvdO family nonheme iron enzyme [Pseudomonadota bacterium]